ncbi:Sulfurtransferase TusA [Candidatus Methylomirabilis lanthanidiphila]|uniref:Sulfurtransferase TusA n=1 Tax=Candidatus Methylomirabilis lanthanidiphila TaxID=2211376 RepID=A0A564ZK38_9BACT|nr:sulfurtransferase TusA family protein [Candidatus Methylomirabilis lanthanidiphila]VUZ85664.1 Sulfurtransferase TusA [Candidatus Methylomirabilis lanthanidiphila]
MAKYSLDVTGEICPYPLMLTRQKMGKLTVGDQLVVTVDYAKSAEDIPRWAKEEGHSVLAISEVGRTQWEIVLEKA